MARSSDSHLVAALPTNNGNTGGRPQQIRSPVFTPAPDGFRASFAMSSAHSNPPTRTAASRSNSIAWTTTIEAPFHLVPAAVSTPMPFIDPRGIARDVGANLPSPPPQPLYQFDIIGDEVSVIMLSGSAVVSKWREPPAQVPTPTLRRQDPPASKPMSAELSPLARQQIGYIAIETTVVSVHTSSVLPASHPVPVAPWNSPVVVNPVPHPLTLTPDAQSSYATGVQATPTHSADSSNNNRSQPRLSDGYIVLISIAALFVLATLFYFYARYSKRRKAVSSRGSPSLPRSHASRSPSASIVVEQKRQVSTSRTNCNMPDSGTGMNFQQKSTDAPDVKGGRTLEVNTVSVYQPPSALFRSLSNGNYAVHKYADLHEQDRVADNAVKDRYIKYRHPGSMGTDRGAAIMQNGHSMARQKIPSFQGNVAGRSRELPTRSATTEHVTHPLGQFEMPLPPSRPYQAQAQPESQLNGDHVRHYRIERPIPTAGNSNNAHEPTNPLSASCTDMKGKCALLDTSSANPSLSSKMGNSPRARIKTRKLVRDPVKRPVISTPAKTEHKSLVSPNNLAKLDEQDVSPMTAEVKKLEQSKSNHSMSLRTKLWSSVHLPKKDKDTAVDDAVEAHPSALKTDHDVPDEPDKLSPLMDSIESFSESYQFAIRHKPPLGPLRVVESHAPALPDELAIVKGHYLFVIGEFADGWVLAINASSNNECGMVPRRCLFFPTAPFMTKEAITASMSPSVTAKTVPHSKI
ncbi:hypothetical protein GGH93_005534 [Coemansia aciculifera]|nr:hypothetical protein GGH93_005534 [Coemansia aciculifera]